ncbi:MAG: hypothetical protein ACU0CA_05835 [Paracoccaceae bacterium]
MQAFWKFGGRAAFAPGKLTFQVGQPGVVDPLDPRCDCQPFIKALNAEIESNDYFIRLYRGLAKPPAKLDQSLKDTWTAITSEALMKLQAGLDKNLSEAVDIINKMPGGRHRTQDKNIEAEIQRQQKLTRKKGGKSAAFTFTVEAEVEPGSCDIVIKHSPKGCAADVIVGSAHTHERVHQKACKRQEVKRKGWTVGTKLAKKHSALMHDPALRSAEEILAYKASNRYVHRTYKQMCGKPLPKPLKQSK